MPQPRRPPAPRADQEASKCDEKVTAGQQASPETVLREPGCCHTSSHAHLRYKDAEAQSRGRTVAGRGAGATVVVTTPYQHVHTHRREQGLQTEGPRGHTGHRSEGPATLTWCRARVASLCRGGECLAFNSSVWKAPHAHMRALRLWRRQRTETPSRCQPQERHTAGQDALHGPSHPPLATYSGHSGLSLSPPGRQLPDPAAHIAILFLLCLWPALSAGPSLSPLW